MKVIGLDKLLSEFTAIGSALTTTEARQAFLSSARIIRDQARINAPRAQRASSWVGRRVYRVVPGQVKKSIISRSGRSRNTATAFTSVEVTRGMVNAPHGHLVEWGTTPRRAMRAKVLMFKGRSGVPMITRSVAGMRGRFYFSRAVQSKGSVALAAAAAASKKLIEKRGKAA